MSDLTNNLKRCPFCGGEARFVHTAAWGDKVECKQCDAKTGWCGYKAAAVDAWNRRVQN